MERNGVEGNTFFNKAYIYVVHLKKTTESRLVGCSPIPNYKQDL
jgi:hypothetical protein